MFLRQLAMPRCVDHPGQLAVVWLLKDSLQNGAKMCPLQVVLGFQQMMEEVQCVSKSRNSFLPRTVSEPQANTLILWTLESVSSLKYKRSCLTQDLW